MNGKLVVLEGLDGSGKSTQFERVFDILSKRGDKVRKISFPDYDEPSSALVKMYLGGEFSDDPDDVNAYAASTFYAVDRYASFMKYWKNDFLSGVNILAARYATSNCIYQMAKLDKSEWDGFLKWLDDFEYVRLGIPNPDNVLFLDMPIEISQRLLTERYGGEDKKDIHESHVDFLNRCRQAALYSADKLGWKIIECSDGEKPLGIDVITDRILSLI